MKADTPIAGYVISIDFSQKEEPNRAIDLLNQNAWIESFINAKEIPDRFIQIKEYIIQNLINAMKQTSFFLVLIIFNLMR